MENLRNYIVIFWGGKAPELPIFTSAFEHKCQPHISSISSKSRGQTWKPLRVGMDAILGQNHPAERIPSSTFQPSKYQFWKPTINHQTNQPFIINQPPQQQAASPASPHIHIPHPDPTTQVPFAGRVLHGPLDHLVTIWADFWDNAWLQLRFLRLSTQVGFHRLRLNDVAYGVWDGDRMVEVGVLGWCWYALIYECDMPQIHHSCKKCPWSIWLDTAEANFQLFPWKLSSLDCPGTSLYPQSFPSKIKKWNKLLCTTKGPLQLMDSILISFFVMVRSKKPYLTNAANLQSPSSQQTPGVA